MAPTSIITGLPWIVIPFTFWLGQQGVTTPNTATQNTGTPNTATPHTGNVQPAVASQHGTATLFVAASDATPNEKAVADRVCDGNSDEIDINLALQTLAGAGGSIALSSGTFHLDAPARLTGNVHLLGQGRDTTLRASAAFQSGEGILDGAYHGMGAPLDLLTVSYLTIDGNRWGGASTSGVHVNITSKVGFRFGSPDACFQMHHVLVANVNGHGLHMQGGHNRAARIVDVRVWNVEGDGFRIDCPDGNYTDCDAGSSLGMGFRVTGANNHFTACKAWYSDEDGWDLSGVRNTLAGCTAQDNAKHGFAIRSGMQTLTACHADSNSYLGGGAMPDAHQGLYDGFHVAAGNVTLAACFAYDKNEGGRGRNQRYGTFVSGNQARLNMQVANGNSNSHDNFTGGIGGALTSASHHIIATGQDSFVSP